MRISINEIVETRVYEMLMGRTCKRVIFLWAEIGFEYHPRPTTLGGIRNTRTVSSSTDLLAGD